MADLKQKKAVLTITDEAAEAIKQLISKRNKPTFGIRVGIKSGGCSGLSYTIEYADSKSSYEEEIHEKDVTVLIDPKALMYLIGTEMDYIQTQFKSGFEFINPNERGKCGCGKSFNV